MNLENKSLQNTPQEKEESISYDSDSKNLKIIHWMKMTEDMEINRYIKLRLWVSALDHDDMDLSVKLEKRN